MAINQEVRENESQDANGIQVSSIDKQHRVLLFISPMPTVRSRLHIACMRRSSVPEQGGWTDVIMSAPGGFAMDNATWSRSLLRGDKFAVSDRNLTDHLLLDLPAGRTIGTLFYSTRGAEPFKIYIDGPVFVALRRWLTTRDEVAVADRLPDLSWTHAMDTSVRDAA